MALGKIAAVILLIMALIAIFKQTFLWIFVIVLVLVVFFFILRMLSDIYWWGRDKGKLR